MSQCTHDIQPRLNWANLTVYECEACGLEFDEWQYRYVSALEQRVKDLELKLKLSQQLVMTLEAKLERKASEK